MVLKMCQNNVFVNMLISFDLRIEQSLYCLPIANEPLGRDSVDAVKITSKTKLTQRVTNFKFIFIFRTFNSFFA